MFLGVGRDSASVLVALFGVTLLAACGSDDATPAGQAWDLGGGVSLEPVPDMSEPLDAAMRDMTPPAADMTQPEPDLEVMPDMSSAPDMAVDLGAPPLAGVGEACSGARECLSGACFVGMPWAGGYCSTEGCNPLTCAGIGGTCVVDPVLPSGEAFCALPCETDRECRSSYACRQAIGISREARVCLPPPPPEPVKANDGEACQTGADCSGGTCLTEADGWPGGYCTTVNCQTRVDCASVGGVDNRCYQNPQGPNLCVRICTSNAECRADYVCDPVGGSLGFCVPDPSEPLDVDFSQYPFTVTCGAPSNQSYAFNYTIAPETTGYMVTTVALDGRQLFPISTQLPTNRQIDFTRGVNSFQATTAQLFGWVSPIQHPATAELGSDLAAGQHQHRVYAESSNVCHYVLEESSQGSTIDLNIYLVGVRNIDAAGAPTNANMQAVLSNFSSIYQGLGLSVGTVRYIDITGSDATRYQVVRSEADLLGLASLSTLPGPTLNDALSVNIFFVRSIALGGGTIGISQGLPGPAGLHGTGASGVIFTSEFLGRSFTDSDGSVANGNDYTGVVMAHEVGHYLGLFHTTEQGGRGQDPLPDTPFCPRQSFPNNCPDLNNLMFPFAGITHRDVTPGQQFVVKSNPLTKN